MKAAEIFSNRFWISLPPWVVAGASLVLFPLVGFATFNTIQSQKESAYRLLLEKGAALIRAFEAGTRTGIATPQWQGFRLQHLLQETARQPDIRYLFVIRENGTIIAHSQPESVGMQIQQSLLPPSPQAHETKDPGLTRNILYWRILQNGDNPPVFEVYRPFLPDPDEDSLLHQRLRLLAGLDPSMASMPRLQQEKLMIFIGLDMHNIERARESDMWHSLLMSGMMLLVGFAGIVFILLFQSYQLTRSTLSRVRAFSNHLVENMPMGVMAFDEELMLKSLNPFAEKLLCIRAPIPGTPARLVLPPPLFDFLLSADLHSPILDSEGFYREIPCATEDKPLRLEAALSRISPGTEGEPGGIMLLIRDLSEIDALRKEILRNQRLVTVGKLAAGVAHEIRNPLSSIKGFATLFRQRHADSAEERNIADIMIQEVDRLNRVVGQLLDFSKPVVLSCRCTRIHDLAEATLQLVSSLAITAGVRLENRISPELHMRLDEDRIRQLLLNLFLNAIDAMKDKGGILSIEDKVLETEVRIEIKDTGKGVDDHTLPHIFDPYFTTKSSGTGLGLAIAHNIMEAHHGKIVVTSVPGQGSTFTLIFSGKDIQDASCHPHR
ncbi:ATP-binding protein [Desulfobotulus sp. H1]|uniref:histidine kinase n=1 Tax=Desulfobotulus pelophilus TaxID=2823377 RepID=A0ABT3NAY6_9BACT|nr:ATP-binding protein [Desulfobotulus pelophilus]MCW7754625.1 ATP-binding protein [Desulfobotulus pelophilus]